MSSRDDDERRDEDRVPPPIPSLFWFFRRDTRPLALYALLMIGLAVVVWWLVPNRLVALGIIAVAGVLGAFLLARRRRTR